MPPRKQLSQAAQIQRLTDDLAVANSRIAWFLDSQARLRKKIDDLQDTIDQLKTPPPHTTSETPPIPSP